MAIIPFYNNFVRYYKSNGVTKKEGIRYYKADGGENLILLADSGNNLLMSSDNSTLSVEA